MSNYQTLFEKFGGSAGIHEMAFVFHQKLLRDQNLRRYFRYLDIDDFIVLQQELFEVALGKTITENKNKLVKIRQCFVVEPEHFPRFIKHIADTLESNGLAAKDKANILSRVTAFAETITGLSYSTHESTSSSSDSSSDGNRSTSTNSSSKESQTIFEDKEVDYESSCI